MARSRPQRRAAASTTPPSAPARFTWIAVAGLVAVAAIGAAWWWLGRTGRPGAVVLVSIDTLRADHLPAYGYTEGRTPVIDAFAKQALLFERAYAHAPQTLPSHASILTGLLPFEHGVRDNLGFTLKSATPTLASMFKAAGYRTGGFVSAYVLRPDTGISQGFDTYSAEFPAGSQERSVAAVQRPGTETLAAADAWLQGQTDDHFFLFFHLYEPHTPYTPPARFASLAPYDGEIAFADEIVGKLFDDLKQRGWYDNATVVLLSDHGEGLGDHGEDEHGLFLYDATTHVPLLVKLPGNRRGGQRVGTPVQHIDLVPTLAALAHLRTPAGLRGRSLLPLLEGQGSIPPQGVYAEAMYPRYHFGWSELLSLTDERYRFIKAPKPELYDLDRDPVEASNLVIPRAQVAQAMRAGLDQLIAGHGIDAPAAVSAEDRQRLAALGYIGSGSAPADQPGETLPDPKDKAAILKAYRAAVADAGSLKLAQAADEFHAILQQEPGMVDVWNQYGTVLSQLGRDNDALAALREVLKQQPDKPIVLIDAATILLKLGRYDEARAHAELAAKDMPAAAHQLLAEVALARKDSGGALREAALAEQADPTLPMPDYVHGLIEYDGHHYTEALPYFLRAHDRVAKRTMQMVDLRYYIADCLARLGRNAEAERFFNEEIGLYPSNVRARVGLAMLLESEGRSGEADQAITRMVDVAQTPDAYRQAAKLWGLFGRPEKQAAVLAAARARFGKE